MFIHKKTKILKRTYHLPKFYKGNKNCVICYRHIYIYIYIYKSYLKKNLDLVILFYKIKFILIIIIF